MDKLDFVAREGAVVDGVMANGLVDNGQHKLALAYVLQVLKAREEVSLQSSSHLISVCKLSRLGWRWFLVFHPARRPRRA